MKRVTIAIASPGDVQEEREAVRRVFTSWNDTNEHATLHPKMWEFAVPELGKHPQDILNQKIIDSSDLLIAIFWSKLGTPTRTAPSGTVEEIFKFIEKKGAQRVMLYFCKRSLPNDIDPAELMRLNDFKAKMRTAGLFHEYITVEEFERDLYPHLDVKVEEVLTNQIVLPVESLAEQRNELRGVHPDPQLRTHIEFGTTLDSIAEGLAARTSAFQAIGGSGDGTNKYYRLGAHVYSSAAMCLDRFLTFSSAGISVQNIVVLEKISSRLKRLASQIPDPDADFRKYWNDGSEIAQDLLAQVSHMQRNSR
ncbi:MAG: hypothetical protein ABSG04_17090 [Verrucomicrobiota bacterium]|jgi:hypothetical protein